MGLKRNDGNGKVRIPGRLAIDKRYQAEGSGRALLRDAIVWTLRTAAIAGIRAILIHRIATNTRVQYF